MIVTVEPDVPAAVTNVLAVVTDVPAVVPDIPAIVVDVAAIVTHFNAVLADVVMSGEALSLCSNAKEQTGGEEYGNLFHNCTF